MYIPGDFGSRKQGKKRAAQFLHGAWLQKEAYISLDTNVISKSELKEIIESMNEHSQPTPPTRRDESNSSQTPTVSSCEIEVDVQDETPLQTSYEESVEQSNGSIERKSTLPFQNASKEVVFHHQIVSQWQSSTLEKNRPPLAGLGPLGHRLNSQGLSSLVLQLDHSLLCEDSNEEENECEKEDERLLNDSENEFEELYTSDSSSDEDLDIADWNEISSETEARDERMEDNEIAERNKIALSNPEPIVCEAMALNENIDNDVNFHSTSPDSE